MKKNNLLFLFVLIIFFAVVSLFLPWGAFTQRYGPGMLLGEKFTTTGITGYVLLFGIKVPNWLLAFSVILSALIHIANLKRIVQIPRIVSICIDIFALLCLVFSVYIYSQADGGSVQLGLIVILLTTISSLFLKFKIKL